MKRHAKLFTSHGLSRQTAFRLSLSGMRHAAWGMGQAASGTECRQRKGENAKHRKPRDRRCSEALINIFNLILFNYTDVYSFRRCVASLSALNCERTHTCTHMHTHAHRQSRPFSFINYKLRADYTHYKRFLFAPRLRTPSAELRLDTSWFGSLRESWVRGPGIGIVIGAGAVAGPGGCAAAV